MAVFPNPVKDIIQLQLNLPVRKQVEWTITDNAGRTAQRGKIAAPAGAYHADSATWFEQLVFTTLH